MVNVESDFLLLFVPADGLLGDFLVDLFSGIRQLRIHSSFTLPLGDLGNWRHAHEGSDGARISHRASLRSVHVEIEDRAEDATE